MTGYIWCIIFVGKKKPRRGAFWLNVNDQVNFKYQESEGSHVELTFVVLSVCEKYSKGDFVWLVEAKFEFHGLLSKYSFGLCLDFGCSFQIELSFLS